MADTVRPHPQHTQEARIVVDRENVSSSQGILLHKILAQRIQSRGGEEPDGPLHAPRPLNAVLVISSRMLKKSASGVLASLRGSRYRSVRLASSLAAALPAERRVLARRGWAGEKSGLFEHPEAIVTSAP